MNRPSPSRLILGAVAAMSLATLHHIPTVYGSEKQDFSKNGRRKFKPSHRKNQKGRR